MSHQPYERIISNANCAILFIHGILGSPDHFNFLIPYIPQNISVCNLLLDGHGKGVRNFSQTSMTKWETQVKEKISQLLEKHDRIFIVAHSMGTLLAIQEALQNSCINRLFLLAVPISPFPRLRMFSNAYKVITGRICENDIHGITAREACSIQPDANIIDYLPWIKRYRELFQKVKQIRTLLPELKTPCIAFQSKHDEMVSFRSVRFLKRHSNIDVRVLRNSWHNLYCDNDRQIVIDQFTTFMQNIK